MVPFLTFFHSQAREEIREELESNEQDIRQQPDR